MIRFTNLSLGYGDRTLIDNLTGEVAAGALTALVGRNGTGKSTLLRAIAGIGDYFGGSIELCGRDLRSLSLPTWRQLSPLLQPIRYA